MVAFGFQGLGLRIESVCIGLRLRAYTGRLILRLCFLRTIWFSSIASCLFLRCLYSQGQDMFAHLDPLHTASFSFPALKLWGFEHCDSAVKICVWVIFANCIVHEGAQDLPQQKLHILVLALLWDSWVPKDPQSQVLVASLLEKLMRNPCNTNTEK